MNLPFLKKRPDAGVVVDSISFSDGSKPEQEEMDAPLNAAAEDLLRGIAQKDAQMIAGALRAAFEILESEPHVEEPAANPEE
jgi:hypothetical protein